MTDHALTSSASPDADLVRMIRDVLDDGGQPPASAGSQLAFDDALWTQLTELGLVALTTPEADGGSGAGWLEAAVLLREAAAAARSLPVAETDLLANWLLRAVGLPNDDPTRSRTVAVVDENGEARAVPWLREVSSVVVVHRHAGGAVTVHDVASEVLAAASVITDAATNSGQPRADLTVAGRLSDGVEPVDPEAILDELMLRGALARALQCTGALERAVDLTVDHVRVREQFGRPIATFQAVQRLVADSAAEADLARAAVDAAVLGMDVLGPTSAVTQTRVAVARSCVGHAASVVVRNAHQAHGAIGTTREHPLHLFTLAVLDWRKEFGTTRSWDRALGRLLRDRPTVLWSVVIGQAESAPRV